MAKWGDILTDTEKTELKRLMDVGVISDTNIQQFADRFLRASNRETAFQQALDTSTGAAIGRDWHGIQRGFADPRIGIEATKEHYREKGIVGGTADIAWSAITTPVRSWAEILGGEPGLGENPLETLVGALSVVPVGSAAAGVTSAGLRAAAKGALRSGNLSRATQLMKSANRAGRVTQSRVWRPTAQAIEAGDIVTGIEEWPMELIGEGILEAGSALGGQTFNRLRSQESIIDSIVNTARGIQSEDTIEEKIHQSTQIIGDPVLQRIMAENADVEDIESARDLLEINALLRYVETETTETEDTNAEATAESEAHDAQTGSQTTPPRPWHELQEETARAERALQEATAQAAAATAEAQAAAAAAEAGAIADAEGPLAADTERATEHAAATERAANAQVVEQNREAFDAFRNEYLELYDALTGGDATRTRDMMYSDFANDVNPTETLEEGVFAEETEGINVNEESVAVARTRTHTRLREMLGDTLYDRYYGQAARPSVDDRVRAADALTDELVEGGGTDVTGTDEQVPEQTQTADAEPSLPTEPSAQETPETQEATQTAQPLPEDTEGRAAVDAARQEMPEVVGNEDIIRWQRTDGTWEETPVVYKLIERSAAVASHRFTENQVSLERNPIYNWALGIQGRRDARLEEIQDRLRPDEFNANLLLERTQGMTRGTPTLLPSYDAAAGNHRLMLLDLMYRRAGSANSQAQQYVEALNEMLPAVGIDPAAVEQINEPILVRQVLGDLENPQAFAEASNREDAAPRTAEHQALEDAESLTTRILEMFNFGEIGGSNRRTIAQHLAVPSRQNLQALTIFVEALPPAARARYRRGDTTRLAAEAKTLFENAVLAKTFIDTERGRLLFAELTDGTLTPDHAARAVRMMLPHLAKFDAFLQSYNPDVQALSISGDVAAAIQYLSSLRGEPNNLSIGQVGAHLDTPAMMEADTTLTPEAHALMKAIYASQSANQIANIVIETVGQLMENIQESGVPVSTQITLTPVEYGGPSKLETLNTVIEESKTPARAAEETGQQTLEGTEDETDTGRTPTEPTGDGDPTGDADRTGDVAPDTGSARVGTRGDADGRDRTTDADGESASRQDDESDRGDQPGERTPGADTPGTRTPPRRDSEPTGEDTGEPTPEPEEPDRGRQPLSAAERARQRMRESRGLGTGQQPTPEATPQETETPAPAETPAAPVSAAERARQRMREARGLEKKKVDATPEQQELYTEFLGNLATEYAADLQAQENLDAFDTELLDALTAETRTAEQQALYDEFLGHLAAEYIADLQAQGDLDDFDTELLAALEAHVGETGEEASLPEETPAEDTPEPTGEPGPGAEDISETGGEGDNVESVPDSVPIGETHVSPLHEPTALASQNHPDVSDIELNLSESARGVVSAAQELAVKLMKRSSAQFTSVEAQAEWMQGLSYRLGFLLGDGTGSGKTITGLTFILDQIANGNKQHFIIGPKQDLFYNNYTTDMKKLGGNTRNMFNFGELKVNQSKKKGAGIGFSTYSNLTGASGRPNLVTGRIGLRLSQFLQNMTGKRPPLEILNPEANTTIQFLKRVGRGSFPTFEALNATYQGQNAEDQKALLAALPKPLQQMLNVPKRYTAKKYAEVLKIFKAFDSYDTKYKTASVEEFIEAASKFEGVLLFDEAHSMRGDTSTTRDVGLLIQRVAPNARVVYLSATPITKVEEIRYAERLGLWGEGTAFDTYEDFEKAFAGDDLTAKEVIAKDLKGYGRYLRRSLDMSGVQWENREHALTDEEIEIYDAYVGLLQQIKQNLRQWADRQTHLESGRGSPRGQLIGDTMKQFYNRQQEFFNQLQTAFKTQALLPEIINQLKAGNKVAVQLSKTGETAQKRAEDRAGKGVPDLSLKNLLIDFLMSESSPIYRRVPKGTGKSIDFDTDADGNKIINSEADRRERDALVRIIEETEKDLPGLPIDMLHAAVREAGFDTAEITGRSHYYVDGTRVNNPKNTEAIERQFRETRDLNFIIISDAGGEGRNLQTMRADSPLVDYDIETGWNVVNTIQKFGRFKRTGAAHDPLYVLTQTDSPASKRIAGALALKLTDMGALATGQARSQMNLRDAQQQAETEDADNYILGSYGKRAMRSLWMNFHAMQDAPYIRTLMMEMGYADAQGNPRFEEDTNGNLKRESIPDPEQYLSRLFGVRYQKQAEYAELFFTQLDGLLAAATEQGTLDQGTTQLKARNAQIARRHPLTVHPDSGTTTDVVEVTGEQALQRNSWEVVEGIRNKQPGYEGLAGPFSRYVRNTKSGKIYALFVTTQQGGEAQTTARGVTNYKRFGVRGRPDYINSTQLASGNWETLYDASVPEEERSAKLAEAKRLWEEAGQTAEATRPLSRVMITGMLLPIWDKISVRLSDFKATTTDQLMEMLRAAGFRSLEELQRSMQIRQLLLADGTPIQGRILPVQFLESLFSRFGIDVADTPFADLVDADTVEAVPMDDVMESVSENKAFLTLDNGAIVSQVGDSLEIYGSFSEEDITALGLTPVGEVARGNELIYNPETPHSTRYNIGDTELARWELPIEKLPDLLGRIPPDTITARGDAARPLNVEGISKPETPAPHPDPSDRISRYRQFVKLRQLMLPYAENINDNSNWERGQIGSHRAISYLYYLDDVDKYLVMEFSQSRYGTNMTFSIEGETHDRLGSVQLSVSVPEGVYSGRVRGIPRFAADILAGNTEHLADHTFIDNAVIQNLRMHRVRRELQKEDNQKFKPSTDLERVDVSEFSNTSVQMKTGTLPDGQSITMLGSTIKRSRTSAQWVVALRIGEGPLNTEGVRQHIDLPKYFAYALSAKDIDAAMDNMVRKLRGDTDIMKGLSSRFSESTALEGVLNAYDKHQQELEAEQEAERQRAQAESEQSAAPRISRSGEVPGAPETQYALDHEAIASLETDVEKIVATLGDTEIRRRILGIYTKIMNGQQVNLVGQKVNSAHEVAILAQAFRNPLIEVYRTLYIKDGVIVAHDGYTLNSSQTTRVAVQQVKNRIKKHDADGIYMLHNHPTSFAMLSSADISADHQARAIFGTKYLGEVVVNSGTYAQLIYNADGTWDHQDMLTLTPEDVGWDTTSASDLHGILADDPLYKGFTPGAIAKFAAMYPTLNAHRAFVPPGISPQDPEYRSLLNSEDAPKAIAALGNYLKTREGWTVIVGMSNTGYITLMTEFQGLIEMAEDGKLQQFLYENMDTLGADIFHILSTGGQDVRRTLMDALGNSNNPTGLVNGVASLWVDGESVGTVVPLPKVPAIPSPDIKEGRETEYVTQPPPQGIIDETTEQETEERPTPESQEMGGAVPETRLKTALLEAIEAGDFTDDGSTLEVEVEAIGTVRIDVDETASGPAELLISPPTGDSFSVDLPPDIVGRHTDGTLTIEEAIAEAIAADIQATAPEAETPDIESEEDPDAEEAARRQAIEDMGLDPDDLPDDFDPDSDMDDWEQPESITVTVGDQEIEVIHVPEDTEDIPETLEKSKITDFFTYLKNWWKNLTQKQKAQVKRTRKFTKPVVIAGVRHELHPDRDRRLRSQFDRGIDAEHMTSGNEAKVLERILQSGVVKATHPVGTAARNAYFSYGPYYRRNENRHDYGVILDLEKLLRDMPDITGTIHQRGNWNTRKPINSVKEMRQLLRDNQIGHPDTVIEIRVPRDVDVNTYFAGVVMDGKVYAKKEYLVENQLTRQRLPSRRIGASEHQLKQNVRQYKKEISEMEAELKPQLEPIIDYHSRKLRPVKETIRKRTVEKNRLQQNLSNTNTPHYDKNRIEELERWIQADKTEKAQIQKTLRDLRAYKRVSFMPRFYNFDTLDSLEERKRSLKRAEDQLEELQNPRRRRHSILRTKASPIDAPDPADKNAVISIMPNPDDFDQETRDDTGTQQALNTFTDPESGIRQILGLSSRQGARLTRKTFSSGFGILEELSKTDRDGADKIGDVIRKNVLRRQFIAKSQFARDATRLLPILKELEGYVNDRATPTVASRGNPQARAKRGAVRQRVNDSVWRFIEENKTIKDPKLLEIAKKLKEAWREMLIEGTLTMLDLTDELKGVLKEDVFITDSAGNRVPWYPESFDGFIWDAETRSFKRNEGTAKNPNWVHYTIEAAHRKAEKLYTPHYFKHNRLRSEFRKLQQLIDNLNALLQAENPAADTNRLRAVGIVEAPQGFGGYLFEPDGTIQAELSEMLAYAADYYTQKELSMRGLLEYTDAGLRAERYGQVAPAGAVDGEARIGYYGHLERARETDDKFYERDLRLLLETRRLMWDRVGEIATIGQVHPILGTSPRLEAVLEQVRAFRKNKREFALGAVAVALKAGDPKSMFERLPQFGLSVEQGLSVQQDWRVYETDDTGNRVRTDAYQEIDVEKMNLTDEVLETLRTIGFITQNADGVDVVAGATLEDRQLTLARFFYEFYNTIAQREASVKDLYLSLGHWHTRDPLQADDAKFWQKVSDITTATTLSWTTAVQNLLEVPLLTELTGTRTMLQGLTKIFAKESRDQLRALAEGLSHAPRFMAETDLAEKYLGSWVSGFTRTDKISRAIGLGVGLENAKHLITEYVNGDAKTKTRLRRVFDETALDVKVIDTLESTGLQRLLQETTDLIMSGQVTPKFGDTASATEKLAWTVLQHMHYISDQTFKSYDATSLPPFLMKQTPLIRLFMKYKSWMFQHNAFKMKNWRRAVREARAGNYRPLWNMAQSAAWSGVTYSMLLGLYAAASGYDDEDNNFVKGMHAAQTFGMSSVLLEMASRADGNWWTLSRDMMGQAAGPVGSITSQTVAPMITGDWDVAGSQVVRRIPVVNVMKRLGGFRLLEENEE